MGKGEDKHLTEIVFSGAQDTFLSSRRLGLALAAWGGIWFNNPMLGNKEKAAICSVSILLQLINTPQLPQYKFYFAFMIIL